MKTLRRTLWAIWVLAMVLAQPAYADEAIKHDLTVSVHSKQPDPAGVGENVTVVFDLSPDKPKPPSGESVDSKWKHQRFYLTTKAAGAGEGDDGVISSVTVGVATVTRGAPNKVVGIYTVSWLAANVVQIMQTGHTGPVCGVCTPQEMVRQMGLVAAFAAPGEKLVECRGGIDHDKWVPPQPGDPIGRVDTYTDEKTGKVLKTEETPVWGACRTKLSVLEMESTEWLVTHDPEFEGRYCRSPGDWGHPEWAGRFKQAELMANEAVVKLTKIPTIQYEVKLLCNDEEVVTLDQYEERDGYAIFHFETDENPRDGSADTNASGGIYVEDTWLERGVTSASVKYTFEVWANGVKVFSDREITIGPLVDRLHLDLNLGYDPWKPASLFSEGFSPYTKYPYIDDRWRDQPDRKMEAKDPEGEKHDWYFNYAYGMAIECAFTDDLESLGVKASGGDIADERTYPVADAATFLAKGVPKIIEWEGFDDDSEKIHEVPDLSSLATPLAPVKVIKEVDDYVLKIEAVREKDTLQKQRIELRDLKVDYGLEHVFEGVQE